MTSSGSRSFTGSIPEIYDRYLVPLYFDPYAADLARRAAEMRPHDVLEIAAGTGALTRALTKALPDARITATDLSEPMLQRAADATNNSRVSWQQADAQALPFAPHSFDLAVCQFGVMFFPDRPGAYRQVAGVLRPTGRFLFNTWESLVHNDFSRVVNETVAGLYPNDPPRFVAETPHGYHDPVAVSADLRAAGFSDIEWSRLTLSSRAPSPLAAATAICQGTPLRMAILERETEGGPSLFDATERCAAALAAAFGDGAIVGEMAALVVTAALTAAHE